MGVYLSFLPVLGMSDSSFTTGDAELLFIILLSCYRPLYIHRDKLRGVDHNKNFMVIAC